MNKRVLLGMSGGVDSSVSAILLKEQGYEVIGVTMKLWEGEEQGSCCNSDSARDAKRVCDYLGIPHYTLNFKKEFNQYVIEDFVNCYANCKTPNPCIECNKYLKFGAMFKKAQELECDYVATGHYANIEFSQKYNQYVLTRSKSEKKDQSYVLYGIPRKMLPHVLFPLADYTDKSQIREIAAQHHLLVAQKPDSEDICFIPDGNYKKFLEENSELSTKEGNIVDKTGKILGKHKGLYYYTIGQRRGLGIANPVPLFVCGFNKNRNEVIVCEENGLYQKELEVEDVNFLLFDKLENEMEVMTKIRYASKPAKSIIKMTSNNTVKVEFEEPQRGITPGQSAVFYIDDIVVGGGKIK